MNAPNSESSVVAIENLPTHLMSAWPGDTVRCGAGSTVAAARHEYPARRRFDHLFTCSAL
jgi:hypothetical protein